MSPLLHPGRLRQIRNAPDPRANLTTVWVDASYRDGVAGLAIAGAVGDYTQVVPVGTSTAAEVLALRLALTIARAHNRRDLVFRSDCQHAVSSFADGKPSVGWTVERIPREHNRRAHLLAVHALRLHVARS